MDVGYEFLPGDLAEIPPTVPDLLDQNASVGRRVITGTDVEDLQTEASGRYVMLHPSYRFRPFSR